MSSANDNQVGGKHYTADYQHWDYVTDLNLPYLPAQIGRYVTRWQKKNGLEDIRKAIHYNDKLIEVHLVRKQYAEDQTEAFCKSNKLGEYEKLVLDSTASYVAGQVDQLRLTGIVLQQMLEILEGKPLSMPVLANQIFRH